MFAESRHLPLVQLLCVVNASRKRFAGLGGRQSGERRVGAKRKARGDGLLITINSSILTSLVSPGKSLLRVSKT
jgi:hypothetical protein